MIRARRSGAVLAALIGLTACASGGPPEPPEPPPPVEAPGLRVQVGELGDVGEDDLLPAPPEADAAPADPILASPAAADPALQERVDYWILRWQTWGHDYFTRYLERFERYSPLVERELEERGLPPSLVFLPVVESGYNPRATSRVGAAGMWQFMSGTARFLGLEVTPLVDERRDPWRSTEIALDYLTELRDRFDGSWFLALAAYNGGWGRVERTLDRYAGDAEASDSLFWALRHRFPRETRDFVPKLLAAARLASDPEAYGFAPATGAAPARAEEVRVPDATSIDVLARAADTTIEEIETLNPHLRRGYTPPGAETVVRVPAGTADRFRETYAGIPVDERVSFVEHRVRRGQTLSHVAGRYGVPLHEIRAANPGLDPRRLQVGQWITVPRSPSTAVADGRRVAAADGGNGGPSAERASGARFASSGDESGDDGVVHHRVTSGESLWSIARAYGVGVQELRRWNDLSANAVIHPGDELRVRGASVSVHRVQAGDTLSGIASRYGVETAELLRANGLTRGSVIRPGDEVRIPGN